MFYTVSLKTDIEQKGLLSQDKYDRRFLHEETLWTGYYKRCTTNEIPCGSPFYLCLLNLEQSTRQPLFLTAFTKSTMPTNYTTSLMLYSFTAFGTVIV
ncbi:MAG: hypothetical protein K0R55_2994 [Sporomusa sp.]|nr:hypothetical protein [Sporomusa sp.]